MANRQHNLGSFWKPIINKILLKEIKPAPTLLGHLRLYLGVKTQHVFPSATAAGLPNF